MNPRVEGINAAGAARASLAVDNLRAAIILLVLAIHSVLAYLNYLPAAPYAFDRPPFLWRAVPIIDSHRMIGFDIFSAWLDIFVMALFFLLSGLFVWQSLTRKGVASFLGDRMLRLGLPFAFVVFFLMPLALYPTYLQTAARPGIEDFWRHWRGLPFWPDGPMWFLWFLLVADIAAAGLFQLLARRQAAVLRLASNANEHAGMFLASLLLASVAAYVPLALLFGPMPWFHHGPFSFQLSRPGLYAVYFLAGIVIGAGGIERSLLARGALSGGRWRLWLIAAVTTFAIWLGVSAKIYFDPVRAPLVWQIGGDLSFVLACFASGCLALALAMRFARVRTPLLESLQNNSYGIYLLHYVFIVWLQFALLGVVWPALLKAPIVFAGTLALSWAATAALRCVPGFGAIIGGGRRAPTRELPRGSPPSRARLSD
jgi:glucan biosynthesis protein C